MFFVLCFLCQHCFLYRLCVEEGGERDLSAVRRLVLPTRLSFPYFSFRCTMARRLYCNLLEFLLHTLLCNRSLELIESVLSRQKT